MEKKYYEMSLGELFGEYKNAILLEKHDLAKGIEVLSCQMFEKKETIVSPEKKEIESGILNVAISISEDRAQFPVS